jgi:hypothetical protein
VFEAIGDLEMIIDTETQIAYYRAICIQKVGAQEAFGKPETHEQLPERCRISYQMSVEQSGEVSSLILGSNLAIRLRKSDRTIEAWRLFKRLIAISKQHHGPEHYITKDLERGLLLCKTSYVGLRDYGKELFKVLRRDEDKYVVRGPIKLAEGKKFTMKVDAANVGLQPYGTPVVCHGLQNDDTYLNGKIGEIRSVDEDKSIKPQSVKPDNLRILFELPDR